MKHKGYVTVIGSSKPVSLKSIRIALELGRLLAEEGFIVVCGGRGGIMEAVAKGAKEKGGLTIGILPGTSKEEANPYIDIVIPTGLGQARNQVNVLTGDVIVVVEGGAGTLSEVGLALAYRKPVLVLKESGGVASLVSGKIIGDQKIIEVKDVKEAIDMIKKFVKKR